MRDSRQLVLTLHTRVHSLEHLYSQRDKRNVDGKWQEETREDQEEKRKSKEVELELICKRDLQGVCLSNSVHL